jgi:hypothetical protein
LNSNQRFAIRRDGWVRPVLWLFGATTSQSYLEVGPEALRAHYGWVFDKRFAYPEIEGVTTGRWPWWGGLGWRSNLVGRLGLIGSYSGIVDIRLRRRRWLWFVVLPLSCKQLSVSLQDPQGFITALEERLGQRPKP